MFPDNLKCKRASSEEFFPLDTYLTCKSGRTGVIGCSRHHGPNLRPTPCNWNEAVVCFALRS